MGLHVITWGFFSLFQIMFMTSFFTEVTNADGLIDLHLIILSVLLKSLRSIFYHWSIGLYVSGFIIVVIFYIFKVGVKTDRKSVYKYTILYMWHSGVGETGLKQNYGEVGELF